MFIEIDPSIESAANELSDSDWYALNNLAIAAREGSHFVLPEKKTADFLANHHRIGERERAFYRGISSRYSTLAAARGVFSTTVSASRTSVHRRIQNGEKIIIEVPISFFSTTASIQPAILLGENLSDCGFIIEMTRAFAHVGGLKAVKTVFDKRAGGGDTTSEVSRQLLNEGNRLLLVYVDSDRITPEGSLGNTAQKVKGVFEKSQSICGDLVILSCRDLENLLPREFFRQKFADHPDHRAAANFLAELELALLFSPRLYIDIKKGLRLSELLHPSKKPDDFDATWDPVIDAIASSVIDVADSIKQCAKNRSCANFQLCGCRLTGANNTDLLSDGAELYRRNRREYWNDMGGQLRRAAEIVAQSAFDWGCAMQVQAT